MNGHKNAGVTIEPVRKQLRVALPVEAAFRLFTEGMGRWWPLATHSVGKEQTETCFLEGWVGGRIVEVIKDGRQVEWGKVLTWEPYHRVSFHWYPGRTPDTAQEVTITFHEVQDGTLVALVHTGWETLGAKALVIREGYDNGWEVVLRKYSEASTQ